MDKIMKLKEILQEKIKINQEHNEVYMLNELSREDYLVLKHYLGLIGGKYASSGKKFVFSTNPKPFIDTYLLTEKMPIKNPTAFFPTPKELVLEMFKISDFDCLPLDEEYQSKYRVLEPSAGVAGIADLVKEVAPYVKLDLVEMLDTNQEVLKQKGYEPICMDFMNYNTDYSILYDYVLMNPPYQGKTFIKHIKHAYKMLNDRGILCAVIPTSFLTQNDSLSTWLYEKVSQLGEVYHNPENSFKEQGTNVDTCIVYINKEVKNWRSAEYQGCKNYWTWQVWLSLYTSGDVYKYLEDLEYNPKTKEKIKAMIFKELDNYKKSYSYFSYSYIDDYTDKLFEHYCYIHEITIENENKSNEKQIESVIYAEAQKEAFKRGALF